MTRFLPQSCLWTAILGTSCASAVASADSGRLRLAAFSCDVTPPRGIRLYVKPLVTVEHALLAKGIVLENGRQRYVLCAVDWCILSGNDYLMFRTALGQGAETPVSHVAVQTVHQHTAPLGIGTPEFGKQVTRRLAAAVQQATKRLEPFDAIGTGQARVDRVAAIRRVNTQDGTIRTRWSACRDSDLRAMPEGRIDPMLKTITFFQGKRPLVRLHYYATHPQTYYREGRASYDFVGMAREKLEQEENVFQIYFSGCSGDVTAGKYNEGTPKDRAALAERLLAGMKAAVAATKVSPAGHVRWRVVPVAFTSKTGTKMPPIELCSLQLDNTYMLNLPGEPMVEFQLFAQRALPSAFVAVSGTGDHQTGYICTEKAFEEGGYEPKSSALAPRSEKTLKDAIQRLLGIAPK